MRKLLKMIKRLYYGLLLIILAMPVSVKAITILPSGNPWEWGIDPNNPGKDSVLQLINNIITLASDLAGGIAIIFFIWGGFQYFTAFGNEEKANKAKTTITWAIVGLVFIILARIITDEIIGLVH